MASMMGRPSGLWVFRFLLLLHFSGSAASSATCLQWPTSEPFREVCYLPEANVTVSRCVHDFRDEVYINYTVDRKPTTRATFSIDVDIEGEHYATTCENRNISDVVRIVFQDDCEDPVVIVNATATVTLQVELKYMGIMCNKILIGPQRLNVSCQVDSTTGQLSSSVQLRNIDKCSGQVGPAVPIRMSTSVNSSITLLSDGRNESVGDISVQSLPCSDNHSQVYSVSVPFLHTTYTITAEILHALLPNCSFRVTNSTCSAVDTTDPPSIQDDTEPSSIQLDVGCVVGIVIGILIAIVAGATFVTVTIVCCIRKKRGRIYEMRDGTINVTQEGTIQRSELQLGERNPVPRSVGRRDSQRSEVLNITV